MSYLVNEILLRLAKALAALVVLSVLGMVSSRAVRRLEASTPGA